jgi:ribonuclease HI
MNSPHAIIIHCDGAMNYDKNQTGGNGFHIAFPDSIDHVEIFHSKRNDWQGIHRLEIISIIDSMKELLVLEKRGEINLRNASGVEIYTDRFFVAEMSDPYKIQAYRSNGWKTYEQKPIKDKQLWDELDKTRKKLIGKVGGRIEIGYKREKRNKIADKLSKRGKSALPSKRTDKKIRNVSRRLFDGTNINYSLLTAGMFLKINLYAWERVQNEIAICAEVIDGEQKGKIVNIYVSAEQKSQLHRRHRYEILIGQVLKHHITISFSKEI